MVNYEKIKKDRQFIFDAYAAISQVQLYTKLTMVEKKDIRKIKSSLVKMYKNRCYALEIKKLKVYDSDD